MTRRTFQRAGEAERRKDLIAATLDSISEHGLEGATVRDIAARAGVTGGLIRHYFSGKDEMVQAAYREMLAGMTGTAVDAMAEAGDDPRRRLHDFIVANVSPPIADPKALSLWAAFIGRVRSDDELARIHRENYLVFIGLLEELVGAVLTVHRSQGSTFGEVYVAGDVFWPDDAVLRNGWYEYTPRMGSPQGLRLTRSPYTADYAWCVDGQCVPLGQWLPSDGGVTLLTPCARPPAPER